MSYLDQLFCAGLLHRVLSSHSVRRPYLDGLTWRQHNEHRAEVILETPPQCGGYLRKTETHNCPGIVGTRVANRNLNTSQSAAVPMRDDMRRG